ncbi:MAG TPA: hypothetical protein VMV39_02585 [Terracidiphilus sp.]|nr:hypothetical protein [Terracidiphilus sp.]
MEATTPPPAGSFEKTTAESTPPPTSTEPAPKPLVHHRKRAVTKDVEEVASASPGVSAIGQLSTGDPSDLRGQTVDSIAATERTLNGINRKLNTQEEKTAAQIREFLKQAKAALNSGDVDGAHTLALKAKVLLAELSQ